MAASLFSQTRRTFLLGAAKQPLSIGGIRFETVQNSRSKRRYLHIHGNESTAREVLREHTRLNKGTYYFVVGDKRMVPVGDCMIDPNRMFTRDGARKSLERWNNSKTAGQIDGAMALLDRDRDSFLRTVIPPKGGIMIALHNNSDGYSIQDELAISDKVSMPDPDNPRDFMLATNEADYEKIAKGRFNIVLQKSVRSDDGSFSVLAAGRAIRYVNIEAAIGNFEKQKGMLSFLEIVLR